LRAARHGEDGRASEMVLKTLAAMADGGLRDQVGGGFHRYATDDEWLVPHFEKMLYDNAQLAVVYLEAYQLTGDERWAQVARDTLDYVSREMTATSTSSSRWRASISTGTTPSSSPMHTLAAKA
jgi:uncharacterized protein YyaL (SSP411 family)